MKVVKISPRGYCYGVIDALVVAQNASLDKSLPRPIYVLGMIVHNNHVTNALLEKDVITLDGLSRLELIEKIKSGTVIFTAHGVSPAVRKVADEKGLTVLDATCPDVHTTHNLIKEKSNDGYILIYIGKKNHPEPEGAQGVAPSSVYIVENEKDVDELEIMTNKILVTNQTTMSLWDVEDLIVYIKKKYPSAEMVREICKATQIRQEAVATQSRDVDLVIVVGDERSNNTKRLSQVAEEIAKVPSKRIADLSELNIDWLKNITTVGVTSGASTPTRLTREVITFLEKFDPLNGDTWKAESTIGHEDILLKIKK